MNAPKIDSYHFGNIVINGQTHTKDVIIFADHVQSNWRREDGHYLQPADLDTVFAANPQTLIVGQGAYSRMTIALEVEQALTAANINLIAQPSEQACQTYNNLRHQNGIVLAVHLTC